MKAENLNATVESMFYILRFGNVLTEVKKYGLSPLSLFSSTWTVFWVPFLPSIFTGVELCKSGLLAAESSQGPFIRQWTERKERVWLV